MIIFVLMLCAFAVATVEFLLVGLLPEIALEMHVSLPRAGSLVTVYMLVVMVGGPSAVLLTRRMRRRPLLALTMTLAAASAGSSALAGTYGLLMASRIGSALAQALFMAVASQVAIAAVPRERQTAAIAKVFNGFALATVIGLPVGTIVGHAWGWRAPFLLVGAIATLGVAGVLLFCPAVSHVTTEDVNASIRRVARRGVVLGLLTTLFAFTGFVAAFTYVVPALREVAGVSARFVGPALLVYGMGTVIGNVVAGRVQPPSIARVLPVPVVALGATLLLHYLLMRNPATAVVGLFLMGVSAFMVAPLVQTWVMTEAGPDAAGLAAAVNISVFGAAAALGAAMGGAVIEAGLGMQLIGPTAAVPLVAAAGIALALRTTSPARQVAPSRRPKFADVDT